MPTSTIPNQDYHLVIKWDNTLKLNDAVVVHWTNSGQYYHCTGTIVKVNRMSVRVKTDKSIYNYPQGSIITVPRVMNAKAWSWNNCVTPIQLPSGAVPTGDGGNPDAVGYGTRHNG